MNVHPIRSIRIRAARAVRLARTGSARRMAHGSEIDSTVKLPRGSELTAPTCVGAYTEFAGPVSFRGTGNIGIGSWCAVGKGFTVISSNHSMSRASMSFRVFDLIGERQPTEPADVAIGHGCWIGDNVTVLPGSVVGAGVVIGAGSVVRGEVRPYEVIAGVPARSIGSRCAPDLAAALERSRWWTWTPDEMRQRAEFFSLDIVNVGPAEVEAAYSALSVAQVRPDSSTRSVPPRR